LSGTNAALNLTVSGVENDGPLAQNAMYIADNAITSAKIADGAIVNADINASAAIELSKLATSTAGNVIVYNSSGVPTAVAETGDVTISDTGVTAIKSNVSLTGVPLAPTANAATNTTQIATTAFVTTADNLKANIASPTFTGLLSAAGITASGTVRGSGSIVQVVSANQGSSDLTSAGYIGTVTMTPKFADSNILVWINYHAYKYNTTPAVNNYYQLRNVTASTVIRENPYLVYSSPEYMFQGVISGIQSAGSTSSRQYGLLVDSSASARIYFYWSTTYAMEIAV
jgi:hypothetical protein